MKPQRDDSLSAHDCFIMHSCFVIRRSFGSVNWRYGARSQRCGERRRLYVPLCARSASDVCGRGGGATLLAIDSTKCAFTASCECALAALSPRSQNGDSDKSRCGGGSGDKVRHRKILSSRIRTASLMRVVIEMGRRRASNVIQHRSSPSAYGRRRRIDGTSPSRARVDTRSTLVRAFAELRAAVVSQNCVENRFHRRLKQTTCAGRARTSAFE